jgi:hypothetical protein
VSTYVQLMPELVENESAFKASVREVPCPPEPSWSFASFAEEQIRSLVREVFHRDSARQIVFSPVDEDGATAALCMAVANMLSNERQGRICIVEALPIEAVCEPAPLQQTAFHHIESKFGTLRDAARQLSSQLWFMSRDVLFDGHRGFSSAWLRARLKEIQLEFDFTVIQGPAVTRHSNASLLGSLCDGVVLIVEAGSTRRVSARRAKEILATANANLLGIVLSERTFPIPETIYKRL